MLCSWQDRWIRGVCLQLRMKKNGREGYKIGSERFVFLPSRVSLSSDRSVFIMIARDLLSFGPSSFALL